MVGQETKVVGTIEILSTFQIYPMPVPFLMDDDHMDSIRVRDKPED